MHSRLYVHFFFQTNVSKIDEISTFVYMNYNKIYIVMMSPNLY